VSVQEVGLKELLQEASKYYDENNLQIAVEKQVRRSCAVK